MVRRKKSETFSMKCSGDRWLGFEAERLGLTALLETEGIPVRMRKDTPKSVILEGKPTGSSQYSIAFRQRKDTLYLKFEMTYGRTCRIIEDLERVVKDYINLRKYSEKVLDSFYSEEP